MFNQEEVAYEMLKLDIEDQLEVLEGVLEDVGIEVAVYQIATFLMTISMDMDGNVYPAEIENRVEALRTKVRAHLEQHPPTLGSDQTGAG